VKHQATKDDLIRKDRSNRLLKRMEDMVRHKLPPQFEARWPSVAYVAVLFSTAQTGSIRLLQVALA